MSIFHAYDIRGKVPEEITESIAFRIGIATTHFFEKKLGRTPVLLVSRDNRISSHELYGALTQGVLSAGGRLISIGTQATPVFYFGVQELGTDGGIQVTASHNPKEYNGFKIVEKNAYPLSGNYGLQDIEHEFNSLPDLRNSQSHETPDELPILETYIYENQRRIAPPSSFSFLQRIAIDAGNGVSSLMTEQYCSVLSLPVEKLFFELDGTFPHHDPDPLKEGSILTIKKTIEEKKCDMGFVFDADGDRIVVLDQHGRRIPADIITALIGSYFLERNPGETILYDVRSSRVIAEVASTLGGHALRSHVGHSFIKEQMKKDNALFAGELSGHYYFKSFHNCEAPLLVVSIILSLCEDGKKTLADLVEPFMRYEKTPEINVRIHDKDKALNLIKTSFPNAGVEEIDGISLYEHTWWCNVRTSNTEDFLRINIEADTPETLEEKKSAILTLLQPLTL